MNKRFAVAFIHHMLGDPLVIDVVCASSWQTALEAAFPGYLEHINQDDYGTARKNAIDQDWDFAVTEIE